MAATIEAPAPAFVDVRGAAKILSVSESIVRRLANAGKLTKVYFGPLCVRYRVAELLRYGEPADDDLSFLD